MHLDGRLLFCQPAFSQRAVAAAAGKCREPQRTRGLRTDQHQGFIKHRGECQLGGTGRLPIGPGGRQTSAASRAAVNTPRLTGGSVG